MKYLKRFNEELKSSTYKSAGDKFTKMGHTRRGGELLDYAQQVELKEKSQKLIEAQNENKEFGLFDITMKSGYGSNQKDLFSGKFYLQMCLESDWFKDQRVDWLAEGMDWSLGLAMEFAIIPADDETLKMIETSQDKDIEYFRNNSMYDYRYWTNRLWVTLFEKDMQPAFIAGVGGFEDRDKDRFVFNSRSDAMRFKKLLADTLEGKSTWGSWKGKTQADQLKDAVVLEEEDWRKLLMDHYLKYKDNADQLLVSKGIMVDDPDTWPKNPFTEDIHMKIVEAIRRMSVNSLYRD